MLLLAVAAASACRPEENATIALAGEGGDVWAFSRRVEGTVAGTCDDVLVTSPVGAFRARRDDERFVVTVMLREGVNEIRAICRRDGKNRGMSTAQHWTVRLRDVPKAWIRVVPTEDAVALDGGRSEAAPSRAASIVRYEWRAGAGNPAPLHVAETGVSLDAAPVEAKRLVLRTPAADGLYRVQLRVVDALGRADASTTVFRVADGRALPVDLMRESPAWIDDAVVYGVVPSLFGPRGLPDVTARLDDIASLGANVLWLSPLTDSPADDFGYAVSDHFRLRARFGTAADLHRLVTAAHARNLRVVMDFVPNHVSETHRYYVHAAAHGRASPYFAFFDRDAAGDVTHYFDWTNLKNLNFDNPEVQRYTIEAFAHWVREFDIDGFRVDVSWGIRERAPEFWRRWREELKRIKPDLLLLAEASARDGYYFTHGFDAAYDWTAKLGEWAWRAAFEDAKHTASRLRAALTNGGAGFDPNARVFRFLDNNDTGARFVTRYGVARTRAAAAMLLTLPGLPLIYTGQEVGAAFEPYDEGPPIAWTDAHGFRAHYARLIALRHAEPALRSRRLELVATSHDDVLAYVRPGETPEQGVLVMINFGPSPANAALSSDAAVPIFAGAGAVEDILNGDVIAVGGGAPAVPLPAYGVRVLRRAETGAGHARQEGTRQEVAGPDGGRDAP